MRLIIKDSYEELCQWCAKLIANRIRKHVAEKNRCVLGLPTGSTPLGVYRELIRMNRAGELSFKEVITFNMDEYLGLGPDHPHSYHYFMMQNFFNHIDISRDNIHLLDGLTQDARRECQEYEEAIARAGGVDLFLGGVGNDGHIAFNERGSSLRSRTRIKTLTLDTRRVNARFFDGEVAKMPEKALTVGVSTILDAQEVLIMANGSVKARAIQEAVEGPLSHQCPLSVLQLHQKGIIAIDDAASVELKVGTVRYFKEMED
jgi:glucosamine-6-phosphate deaminase